jgi:hypothetical protein
VAPADDATPRGEEGGSGDGSLAARRRPACAGVHEKIVRNTGDASRKDLVEYLKSL